MRPMPLFVDGEEVHTPEGLVGLISGGPVWSETEESWEYEVEWEDGEVDTQPEYLFEEADSREAPEPPEVPSVEELARAIGRPFATWAQDCHVVSLGIVKSGVLGLEGGTQVRVVRGAARGVPGQHSWIVLSGDPYDDRAWIIDPTLWSYRDDVEGVWIGSYADEMHRPHGLGSIWDYGRPTTASDAGEEAVELTPKTPLSAAAQRFLEMCGPLGRRGWSDLANGPMQGWPADEIIAAMDDTESLRALVPIDILGQVTDRNPEGLYW